MVAKKKSAAKLKVTTARAAKSARRPRGVMEKGVIDCMKVETSKSSLCIVSECRERCLVRIIIVCGNQIMASECYWDGRQWVCRGDLEAENQ